MEYVIHRFSFHFAPRGYVGVMLAYLIHGVHHAYPEDHRRWTRQGLCAEITDHGFEVIDCVPVVGPLAWTTIVRLTCACYALRRIPLVGSTMGRLLALVMNARAWIEDIITPDWVKNDNACVYLVLARPVAETSP